MSISILIHLNPHVTGQFFNPLEPISSNDVLALHEALQSFDGDFITAFQNK